MILCRFGHNYIVASAVGWLFASQENGGICKKKKNYFHKGVDIEHLYATATRISPRILINMFLRTKGVNPLRVNLSNF